MGEGSKYTSVLYVHAEVTLVYIKRNNDNGQRRRFAQWFLACWFDTDTDTDTDTAVLVQSPRITLFGVNPSCTVLVCPWTPVFLIT